MSLARYARILDPVAPSNRLAKLLQQHRSNPPLSRLSEIQRRHRRHSGQLRKRFLVLNTYLMDIAYGKGRKPAVNVRDGEIGRYTAANYDLVCLNEVWHREERHDLLDEWPRGTRSTHKSGGRGLNIRTMLRSAGLLTISRDLDVVSDHFYKFRAESGADKYAAKGCLLTVLTIPGQTGARDSSLCLYNTHLNAGGFARYHQIVELAQFIYSTQDKPNGDTSRASRPSLNGTILAGDFNIDRHNRELVDVTALYSHHRRTPSFIREAIRRTIRSDGSHGEIVAEKTGFGLLRDLMTVLGLYDLWGERNGTAGYTSNIENSEIAALIARPDPDDGTLCNDRISVTAANRLEQRPEAIDHMFVSGTRENMGFTLDFTRPRRPLTPRETPSSRASIHYLSDHLGLRTDLLIGIR